jgi:ATP-binding cassette subfamily B protein
VLTKGMAGFRRFTELLDEQPDIADRPGAVPAPALAGDIEFHDVSFSYEGQEAVFRNLSLSIEAGETVALVGPSGAGKTTLASLIPRFYEVDAGAITIDGIDVRDMTLRSLRGQIGLVQQDVFLFNGTLRENIAYGRLDSSDDDVWRAAEQAQLGDFIRSLPQGLDTLVGERGTRLSGGQRQRIAIARMFLKDPPILILDEATSALDAETEVAIQQALQRLAEGRTTLIIAHRLATVRGADRILVVTDSGVAEEGSHDELLRRGGVYAGLVRMQLAGAGMGAGGET